jgi:hypothetical protein
VNPIKEASLGSVTPESVPKPVQTAPSTEAPKDEKAGSGKVSIHTADMRYLLDLYADISKRRVWIDLKTQPLDARVDFDGPAEQALEAIRKALLEKGIELRDTGVESFVSMAPEKKVP